jgi:hypothetical protein
MIRSFLKGGIFYKTPQLHENASISKDSDIVNKWYVDTKVNNTQINTKQYIDGRVASIPIVDASSFVNISGNQNIYGTKYFNSSPTVPNPTSGTHAANKDYVDSKTSSGSYTQSLGSNGWTKLPNGLIIQWGICSDGTNTLPITFPNAFFSVNATLTPTYDSIKANSVTIIGRSSFIYQCGVLNTNQAYYIAIGY